LARSPDTRSVMVAMVRRMTAPIQAFRFSQNAHIKSHVTDISTCSPH